MLKLNVSETQGKSKSATLGEIICRPLGDILDELMGDVPDKCLWCGADVPPGEDFCDDRGDCSDNSVFKKITKGE